jgi:predicted GNAT family acetyltransferase
MGMLCGNGGGLSRLNLVYTPGDKRGQGFGKAVVCELVQIAGQSGAVPYLYTAADNTAANGFWDLSFREGIIGLGD